MSFIGWNAGSNGSSPWRPATGLSCWHLAYTRGVSNWGWSGRAHVRSSKIATLFQNMLIFWGCVYLMFIWQNMISAAVGGRFSSPPELPFEVADFGSKRDVREPSRPHESAPLAIISASIASIQPNWSNKKNRWGKGHRYRFLQISKKSVWVIFSSNYKVTATKLGFF